MCSDRNNEDFVQVDVTTEGDAETSSTRLTTGTSSPVATVTATTPPSVSPPPPPQPQTIDVVTNQEDSEDEDECDDFEDETLAERLLGLTEMFPAWFNKGVATVAMRTVSTVRSAYALSRSLAWFGASVATICLLPVMLESERAQMEEQEASEHRSMMLGPGGVTAGGGAGLPGFQANVPILSPVIGK